jgi:hypothetical protein
VSNSNDTVLGRRIELSEGRVVFVGSRKGNPNERFIGFKNSEGDDTKLRLSKEAADALVLLLTDPAAGLPLAPFPHKMEWRVVNGDEGEVAP